MTIAAACRAIAVAIAVGGVVDPAIQLPVRTGAPVRIIDVDGGRANVARVSEALHHAGFVIGDPATAIDVAVGTYPPPLPRAVPLWIVDTTPSGASVRIAAVTAPRRRFPNAAMAIGVTIAAQGMAGRTTSVRLDDGGVTVARQQHRWSGDRDRWTATFSYRPPYPNAGAARLVLDEAAAGSEGSAADIALPAVRGGVRTLIFEAGVSWPALFVRRALEGQAGFDVAISAQSSKNIATRAGSPPPALTRSGLAAYEAVVVGDPDALSSSDTDALRWFVEDRGGALVLVPAGPPGAVCRTLTGVNAFDATTIESPLSIAVPEGTLRASEIASPRTLPFAAEVLAEAPSHAPVVFAAPRGEGVVLLSGALDAWKYRASADEAFAKFWRRVIMQTASAVPPRLLVYADPAVAAPGEPVYVRAEVQGAQLPEAESIALGPVIAHAAGVAGSASEPIRLWPATRPGEFDGDWTPTVAGAVDVNVTAGDLQGDATVVVTAGARRPGAADPDGIAIAATAGGGRSGHIDQLPALIAALSAAYPARILWQPRHVMRSPWWAIVFVTCLTLEWTTRRRAGAR